MTDDDFAQLFTREALQPFHPQTGTMGLEPVLEVRTPTEIAIFVLALSDFNDGSARRAYLQGLGQQCAQRFPAVEAIRFGSEAWVRTFTAEEAAARGSRLVDAYPDKTEMIIVFGQQVDGGLWLARAPLYRRTTGAIERLGPWQVRPPIPGDVQRSPLLEAFWQGYRQGKHADN